jgi:arylformamidase
LLPFVTTMTMTSAGWLDVTVPIRDRMVHWPGDPGVELTQTAHVERGDPATVSKLSLGVHTGTHVDAPVHFIPGAAGIDEMDLSRVIGVAKVIEIEDPESVKPEELARHDLQPGDRILLKTRNSTECWNSDVFVPSYVYLSLNGARYVAERNLRTIGIDYLSIGGGGEGVAIHRVLLERRICIIEGLRLSGVKPGEYDLICLPLRIQGGDGAPARVLLRSRVPV